ncbi:MAG TPA: NlpC/P60 family protein [Acidimicrobiales bacterium]|jgi:peptidoglycan DL-endopeptidase CwlO|nr:NlpC/P60 family protein [Acidimicrobiales bacterium]
MRRVVPALVAILSCLAASTVWPAAPAAADDLADKKAEAARISRQLEEQGKRISILAEEYNNARLEADRLNERLASARSQMRKADDRAKVLRGRLKGQAVDSYVRGGAVPALAMLVETRTQDDLAIRRQYVKSVTNRIGDTLDELRAVKLTLADQQNELSKAQLAAREAVASVEQSREQAVAAQRAQAELLEKVKGEVAELIAAEERRKAEEEARRVQAELAARKAREEAAAREAAARDAAAREAAAREAAARSAAARSTTTTTTRATATASPSGTSGGSTTTTARATTTTTAPTKAPTDAPPPSAGAAAAIEEAKRQLGKPYQWGGSGPDSFDCSGLTSWAWRAGGKSLPHSSQAQYNATSRVSLADIQPGDLVFYGSPIHHVGLYVGDGQMIEAPETGKNVRYATIYRSGFVGVGRVN